MAFVTPTYRPKSVRNRCVIEVFGGFLVLSIGFRISVGTCIGVFVIGLSQIFFLLFLTKTMTTLHPSNYILIRDLFTEPDLFPNDERLPQNICDGCVMPTGALTPLDTLSSPIWEFHKFYLLRPIFISELVVMDYALRTSLSTFSIVPLKFYALIKIRFIAVQSVCAVRHSLSYSHRQFSIRLILYSLD